MTFSAGLVAVKKPSSPQVQLVLRRAPAGNGCSSCAHDTDPEEEKKRLQRKGNGSAPATPGVSPIVHEALGSPGQPLDASSQVFFESRFGYDFSKVRVHADAKASESAQAVNAMAYTVGQDVVFGAQQYAPHSEAGRRLLAHELTHVVQQGGESGVFQGRLEIGQTDDVFEQEAGRMGEAIASESLANVRLHNPAAVIARQVPPSGSSATPQTQQPPSGSPSGQQTSAQPATQSQVWQACSPGKVAGLNSDLAAAVSWVDEAVRDLHNANRPAHTTGALNRYLSSNQNDVINTIIPKLEAMQTELHGGPTNFQCRTQAQCSALITGGGDAAAISTYPISLCDKYFSLLQTIISGVTNRPATLIHEVGHHAGLGGDTYEWTWPFPGLSVSDRLQNADSFAAFVVTNHSQWLPPATGPTGITVSAGSGVLFGTGAQSPRFVVTASYDTTLARRLLHFFDLHLGVNVDVDMSGAVIASVYMGPRIFAPTSLTSLPVYLDLRGGFAAGTDPTAVDAANQIMGVSGEARLGVQAGHFAGGIGYRHIFNLMRNNADINQLSVYGEILF